MAFTDNWTENLNNNDPAAEGDDELNKSRRMARERLDEDHHFPADDTGESNQGRHKLLTFINQTTAVADVSMLRMYTKTIGGQQCIFIMSDTGTENQVSSGELAIAQILGTKYLNETAIADGYSPTYDAATGQLVYSTQANIVSGIITGMEAVYNDAITIKVNPGAYWVGQVRVATANITTLTIGTDADWIDGSAYSYAGGAGICYIYGNTDGDIKLEETAPSKHDTSGNTNGTLYYHLEGAVYWMLLSEIQINTANQIPLSFVQVGNRIIFDSSYWGASATGETSVKVLENGSSAAWADVNCATVCGGCIRDIKIIFKPGAGGHLYIRRNGTAVDGHSVQATTSEPVEMNSIPLDANGIFEYKVASGASGIYVYIKEKTLSTRS